jgi:hypothetical protein
MLMWQIKPGVALSAERKQFLHLASAFHVHSNLHSKP